MMMPSRAPGVWCVVLLVAATCGWSCSSEFQPVGSDGGDPTDSDTNVTGDDDADAGGSSTGADTDAPGGGGGPDTGADNGADTGATGGGPDTSDDTAADDTAADDHGADTDATGAGDGPDSAGGCECDLIGDACNVATCDPDTGACTLVPAVAGTACGDQTSGECDAPDTCDGAGACASNPAPAGAACGESGTECMLGDACDGDGACAKGEPVADGTPCGDETVTECSAADTCSAGECLVNDALAGSPCGDPGSECVLADACDGSGSCVDAGMAAAGTGCGDADVTECSAADTCDGLGACVANHADEGTACGNEATECTVGDICDGNGKCKEQGFVAIGVPCGDQEDTECSNPDACNGAGTCLPHHAPQGLSCGDPASECGEADACDGQGQCAAGEAVPAGTPCGDPDDTPCSNPDACDGLGSCSPQDEEAGTACGVPGWACAPQDTCDGGGVCMDAGLAPSGTPCGDTTESECTGADHCDGEGVCLTNHLPDGAPCGVPGTECAPGDSCDGAGTCVDRPIAEAGAPCGDQTDNECTNPDTCDGEGTCVPEHAPAGSGCGDVASACSYADSCDGEGVCVDAGHAPAGSSCGDPNPTECSGPDQCDGEGVCSPNPLELGTPCGSQEATECSAGDVCDAEGQCSPNDAPFGTLCGDPGNECTPSDVCDGEGQCLDAGFHGAGTPCGDPSESECDGADGCNGVGFCVANHRPPGIGCGVPGTQCKIGDTCDGDGSCVDHGFDEPGTPCGSPELSPCTDPDTCDGAGSCQDNHAPDGPNAVVCGECGCESTGSCSGGVTSPCVPLSGSEEVCDGVDNNCDCVVDEGLDEDVDGFGILGTEGCSGGTQPDCNDDNPFVNPDALEVCDSVDNDCDGNTDEGVLNECGDCLASCFFQCVGVGDGCSDFDPNPDNSTSLTATGDGLLTLESEQLDQDVAWFVATDGTVAKVDTKTGNVTARFSLGDGSPRTLTVDDKGSAWVGRGGGIAGAVKLGNWTPLCTSHPETCECSDLNFNGTLETSQDTNGDGVISADEMLGEGDECIVLDTLQENLGPVGALATDSNGFVWLAQAAQSTLQRLITDTGTPIADLGLETLADGLAADPSGRVWAMRRSDGAIQLIYSESHEVGPQESQPFDSPTGHHVAVDPYERVWVTAGSTVRGAAIYHPEFDQWTEVLIEGLAKVYGVVFDDDGVGWVTGEDASSGQWGRVVGFDVPPPGYVDPNVPLAVVKSVNVSAHCSQPHGVDIGAGGFVWLSCAGGAVYAMSPDPASAAFLTTSTGASGEQENRGRFTVANKQVVSASEGTYLTTFGPCPGTLTTTSWGELSWSTLELEPGAVVELRVRFATSQGGLAGAAWSEPFIYGFGSTQTSAELTALGGTSAWGQVEIRLFNGFEVAPLLAELSVSRYCE